jgi:hypothetical protein
MSANIVQKIAWCGACSLASVQSRQRWYTASSSDVGLVYTLAGVWIFLLLKNKEVYVPI